MSTIVPDLAVASTVELAVAGDERAFARIAATHRPEMLRVGYTITGDWAMAEDAAQAALWIAWRRLGSRLLNLARVHPLTPERDTVFARASLHAVRAGTHLLELGFSDRATVYLNGRPLFRGDDTYRSRDYRFLGSIGWFDALYLPLEAGPNELVVAVSETFGGWGLMARLVDTDDVTIGAVPQP